jgi:hypothetical protein
LKFLNQARKFLQNLAAEPESKVQYFNVTCASGHRVRGERTEGYQALRCPACGDGVFVLPRSPLPEPVAPVRSQPTKAAHAGGVWAPEGPIELASASGVTVEVGDDDAMANGAEISWEDVADEYLAPPGASPGDRVGSSGAPREDRPAAHTKKPAARPRGDERPEDAPLAGPRPKRGDQRVQPRDPLDGQAEAVGEHVEAPRAGRAVKRQRASVRPRVPEQVPGVVVQRRPASRKRTINILIAIAIPLLVVATVAWRIREQRRQEYPLIAQEGRENGIPALEEGNFDKAYQLLSKAKAAVDGLGEAVEDAAEIKHAADEAEAFVNLCSRSLEELLAEAAPKSHDDWKARFDALYKGRYIVFDTHILEAPAPGQSSPVQLEYRVFPEGQTTSFKRNDFGSSERNGRIDLTGFQLFDKTAKQAGDRVTFAGKLASFEYNPNEECWVIKLQPKSGVYITHTKALEALGWPSITEADSQSEGQP